MAGRWAGLTTSAKRAMLQCLIACIEVRRETVEMWLRPCAIPSIVGSGFDLARSLTDRMGPHNDAGQAGIGGCLVSPPLKCPGVRRIAG